MRELRNRPIALTHGPTRACQREEKTDLQRPNNVPKTDDRGSAWSRAIKTYPSSLGQRKHHLGYHLVLRTRESPVRNRSLRKADCTLASPISLKSRIYPGLMALLLLILAFRGRDLLIRLARKVQF